MHQLGVQCIDVRSVKLFGHAGQGPQQRPSGFCQRDASGPDSEQTVRLRRQTRKGLLACEKGRWLGLGSGLCDKALGELVKMVVSGAHEIFLKGHGTLSRLTARKQRP